MSYFGQKNYNQELGNGALTIAEAGCFLVAFCNLLSKYDGNIDPPTLNAWFKSHGVFLKDPDGSFEDLAWSSITKYDGSIRVVNTGSGPMPAGLPAIVKFIYRSARSGQMITHFCLADRVEGNQLFIVDSYDGLIKGPGSYEPVYGRPVEWASYVDVNAPAITPAPAPGPSGPAAPVSFPGNTQDKYDVVTAIPGYRTAGQAANRVGSNSTVPPGNYFVFNRMGSMVNVTSKVGSPGWWINPADNVAAAPASSAPTTYGVSKAVPGYMTSNQAANHLDATVTVAPGDYFVFNQAHGMINVTKKQGVPGAWINPDDLAAPAPAPAPAAPALDVTGPPPMNDVKAVKTAAPTNLAVDANPWQKTYQEHHDTYVAKTGATIKDLAGKQQAVQLRPHDLVLIAGTFTGPDGVLYGRTQNSVDKGWWYGLPMSNLVLEESVFNVNSDIFTRAATNTLKVRDKLVIAVAAISGFMERFKKKA